MLLSLRLEKNKWNDYNNKKKFSCFVESFFLKGLEVEYEI